VVRFAGARQRTHERCRPAFTRSPGRNKLEVADKHAIEDDVVSKHGTVVLGHSAVWFLC